MNEFGSRSLKASEDLHDSSFIDAASSARQKRLSACTSLSGKAEPAQRLDRQKLSIRRQFPARELGRVRVGDRQCLGRRGPERDSCSFEERGFDGERIGGRWRR